MENMFEQINGCDLDRLALCILAVRKAGLSIDKYAQAGVNQSSGNVYISSEDWAGCVYCSIGMDVQWSYSCPNCGEEHDFDDYSTLEEFAKYWADRDSECPECHVDEDGGEE